MKTRFEIMRQIRKKAARGFSLIEILVVITLMSLLIGMGVVYFTGQADKARIDTTRNQAREIGKALELYKLQYGSFPSTAEGLEVLADPSKASPPRVGPPIMEKIPLDSWKQEFNYVNPGVHNPRGVDVWSDGPDGANSENPIGNWSEEE